MKKFFVWLIAAYSVLLLSGCEETGQEIPAIPTPTYSVSYDGNGADRGSVPTDQTSYDAGSVVTVKGDPGNLVKVGYTFSGWNRVANGRGTNYTEGEAFLMGDINITLYAKWEEYRLRDIGPAGGYIFYIDEADAFAWDYLEAAPDEIVETYVWGAENVSVTTSYDLGTGEQNTINIVSGDAATNNKAADICAEFSIVIEDTTYDDWFLPSRNELLAIHDELYLYDIGGFYDSSYWSSSQGVTASSGIFIIFNYRIPGSDGKMDRRRVRPIRAF